ncbi:MAG TPA: ABC-2 transporter permease [Limnochordales bacterium]
MSVWRSLAWNVYKDLCLMRRALVFYSAMVLVFAALDSGRNSGPMLGVLAASVVMTPNWLAYTEERSRGLVLQRTLPIAPWVIVGAKYVDTLLVAGWLGLLGAVAAMATGGVTPGLPAATSLAGGTAALTVAAALVPAGISLWAFFRWGYQAARYALLGFFMAVMAVFVLLSERLPLQGGPSDGVPGGALAPVPGGPGWGAVTLVGVALGLYLLAAVASYRAMRGREL